MPEADERRHIGIGTQIIREHDRRRSGRSGWYTGRDSPNTKRLVVDQGGYEYDSDYYGDDLPFWMPVTRPTAAALQQLVVPYTLDTNDMRFVAAQGFNTGDHFFSYLKDAFDVLYAEGDPRLTVRRCSASACTAACSARPGRIGRCSASSTTSRRTTRSGSAAASTSRATGASCTPAPERRLERDRPCP